MKMMMANIFFALLLGSNLTALLAFAQSDSVVSPGLKELDQIISNHSVDYEVVKGDSLYKIAKEHGTTVDLLKKINRLEADVIYPRMNLKVLQGKFSIHVDKSENILRLLLEDEVVKQYPVATGKENNTPTGKFKIINKVVDPTWYKSGAVILPESPDNFLGTRWMGFDLKGYGIHGTVEPDKIGRQVSSGCVRMLNADVGELFSLIPHGVEVEIVD